MAVRRVETVLHVACGECYAMLAYNRDDVKTNETDPTLTFVVCPQCDAKVGVPLLPPERDGRVVRTERAQRRPAPSA